MEHFERKKISQPQMRPVARNLKAAAPPKFTQDDDLSATFKINNFMNQSLQKVRISHYEKGVYMFYVQLESFDSLLQALLTKIQSVKLVNLKSRPGQIGMACLAKHHKKIYRVAIAKVTSDNRDSYMCNFVDYGFSANVQFENLFYIPQPFLSHPIFAIQFSFAGLQNNSFKCSIQEVNYYFKEITENKLLSLKCVASDGPPISQYCELYDHDKNILDLLKVYNPLELKTPDQAKLDLNDSHLVKVCYVQSIKDFYIHVQIAEILLKYDMMYDDLQKQLPSTPIVKQLKKNQHVGVVIDSEWYRGKIIDILADKFASVEIIDFGIIEDIHNNNIHILPSKFLNISSFAYRCCLDGFETADVSENITTQFEMFCSDVHDERKLFRMNINRVDPKLGYLAKLDDISVNPPANVNRILLKNSRPLAETITLENAKKRHKEVQKKNKDSSKIFLTTESAKERENSDTMKDVQRNNSQRGRGNQVGRGINRISPSNSDKSDIANNKRQRTHFDKLNLDNNANSIGGTYYKTQKEASVWSDLSQQKSSDWNQAKNITKDQTSDSDWNDTDSSPTKKSQKSKSSRGKGSKKTENDSQTQNNKQKSPPKQEKSSNNKQKSPVSDENAQKSTEVVKGKQQSEKNDRQMKCGWVSTLISINEAYVHFEEHIDGLEKILDELFSFYEGQKGTPLKDPRIGMTSAYKSSDGNWYRCEILSVDSNNYCSLRNNEYGNVESVQNRFIRVLDKRFQKYGKLVEKAYFNIKPIDNSEQLLKEMLAAFNEGAKELNFNIIKVFKDGHIIDAFDPESKENIMENLVTKKKMAQRINETELTKILETDVTKEEENVSKISTSSQRDEKIVVNEIEKAKEPKKEENDVIEKPNRLAGKLTALTSPNDFYLTRIDMLKHFNQFHTDIQILSPALQPLIDFECGTFCVAQDPFDNLWYRAKIIDSDDSIITVLCVDNGKTFSSDNKLSMKAMPEQLQQKSFFGMPCSLPIRIERRCEEDATELMLKMVESEIEYNLILSTARLNYIELFHNNENVSDLLIEKRFADRFEIFMSGRGYTSHVNTIDDFFVQLEDDQLKLDLISSIMERANGNFKKVTDPKINQVVAAKFPDDDGWYRSKIQSIDRDGFTVKFIDYGNSCRVREIGVLDVTIAELPAMSKHCTLFKPKNIVSFTDAAEKEFMSITANGETIVRVKVVKAGHVTEVELYCDGQNIAERLSPLCKLKSDKSKDLSDI